MQKFKRGRTEQLLRLKQPNMNKLLLLKDFRLSRKLLFHQNSLTKEVIERCMRVVAKTSDPNFSGRFVVTTTRPEKQLLDNIGKDLEIFILQLENRWILIYIIPNVENDITTYKILSKDATGVPLPKKIKEVLRKTFQGASFIFHPTRDCSVVTETLLMSLMNLQILLERKQQGHDIVNEFENIKFCTYPQIIKDQLKAIIKLHLPKLKQNKKFSSMFKKFINNLPTQLVAYSNQLLDTLENTDAFGLDVLIRVKQAKERLRNEEELEKFKNDYKFDEEKYNLKIERDFPYEMGIVKKIFDLLQVLNKDTNFQGILRVVSDALGINYEQLCSFYGKKAGEKEEIKHDKNVVSPVSIGEIESQLPKMQNIPLQHGVKSVKDLLAEVQTATSSFAEVFKTIERERKKLEEKNYNRDKIQQWAAKTRGKTVLNNMAESIAMLDRAFYIIRGDCRLRDTQILALLIFFHQDATRSGKLCQIQTGEGKTITVALMATLKALQGHQVDIITSSPILAKDGIEEMKKFYGCFGLSVATNVDGAGCYTADILYGTIGSFQFDYLKEQIDDVQIRSNRKFDVVILDEVDSMLVDNGGHVAQIASPFPGMECLRYIYIKIWQEMPKEEPNEKELYDKIEKELYDKMKQEISSSMSCLIPFHLKLFVDSQLKHWIRNAFQAKYHCHEFQQYRMMANGSELEIVPVDYSNTGVSMKNMIWSAGLTQFIQLKHDLKLTFENLTSCFISNIGYINKYKKENIFGLTGTLGSGAERELLAQLYKVTFAVIPTYKTKQFNEFPGFVAKDDDFHWKLIICSLAIQACEEQRAVLIVCETQADLIKIQAMFEYIINAHNIKLAKTCLAGLQQYQPEEEPTRSKEVSSDDFNVKSLLKLMSKEVSFKLRRYCNEDDAEETKKQVQPGDIILATNIAGRGTDFKTADELEENGGLHVCVCFLPSNQRVEEQAFGRTARQGKKGTAQLIIKKRDVPQLETVAQNPDLDTIRRSRDYIEKKRLETIKDKEVRELNLKDNLSGLFAEEYKKMRKKHDKPVDKYLLEDVKERFAFWFEKISQESVRNLDGDPKQIFEVFWKNSSINIIQNPFNCLAVAMFYRDAGKDKEVEDNLNRALELAKGNSAMMSGIHVKLAEYIVDSNVENKIVMMLKALFMLKDKQNEKYRGDLKLHLEKAKEAIEGEIKQAKDLLKYDENEKTKNSEDEPSKREPSMAEKYITVRVWSLHLYLSDVQKQIETLESYHNEEKIKIGYAKTPARENHLYCQSQDSTEAELKRIGLDTLYLLKKLHKVSDARLNWARGQILAGVIALAVGVAFHPFLMKMIHVAGALILDVIQELYSEMSDESVQEVNTNVFMLKKSFKLVCNILLTCNVIKFGHDLKKIVLLLGTIARFGVAKIPPEWKENHQITCAILDVAVDLLEQCEWSIKSADLPPIEWGSMLSQIQIEGITSNTMVVIGKPVIQTIILPYLRKHSTIKSARKFVVKIFFERMGFKNLLKMTFTICLQKREDLLKKLQTNDEGEIMKNVNKLSKKYFSRESGYFHELLTMSKDLDEISITPEKPSLDITGIIDSCLSMLTKLTTNFNNAELKNTIVQMCDDLNKELKGELKEENKFVGYLVENIVKVICNDLYNFENID